MKNIYISETHEPPTQHKSSIKFENSRTLPFPLKFFKILKTFLKIFENFLIVLATHIRKYICTSMSYIENNPPYTAHE